MTAGLTALFFGLGVGAWVYTKVSRHTGGDYVSSYTVAGIVGLLAIGLFYIILKKVVHY